MYPDCGFNPACNRSSRASLVAMTGSAGGGISCANRSSSAAMSSPNLAGSSALSRTRSATEPGTPNAPPAIPPRMLASTILSHSLLPQICSVFLTKSSATRPIASCPPSVSPSLATLPGACATTLRSKLGSIPDRSRILSTTPTRTGCDMERRIDAGRTESSAAFTLPNRAETPGSS